MAVHILCISWAKATGSRVVVGTHLRRCIAQQRRVSPAPSAYGCAYGVEWLLAYLSPVTVYDQVGVAYVLEVYDFVGAIL